MKKTKDPKDPALEAVDQVLREISGLESSFLPGDELLEGVVAGDSMVKDLRGLVEETHSFPVNGYVECAVAPDKMSAYLSFFPATQGMSPVKMDDIVAEFERVGVVEGVDWSVVEAALLRSVLEGKKIDGVRVANGWASVPEIPPHYIVEPRLLAPPTREVDEQGNVDYKSETPFVMVKKGDRIAVLHPGQEGKQGANVVGGRLEPAHERHPTYTLGENVENRDGEVLSLIDGLFDLTKNVISVRSVLVVDTGVDYHTGNIDFQGDVLILGDVQEGFTVKAGGSVRVDRTLDASVLECEGDLVVKQGIIGRKDGVLQVGGSVRAKFLENCVVEARGPVEIAAGIIRSSVYSGASIACGPRCVVVGGVFFAQDGFRAHQIGGSTAPRTEIYCGLDYSVVKKLDWAKDQSMKLALALQKVREGLKDPSRADRAELLSSHERILDGIRKLNVASANLVFTLDKNEAADVVVTGTVYPGVYIEICHVSFVVKKPLSSSRFFLDKKAGIVQYERIR